MSADRIITFAEVEESLKLGVAPFDFPAAKDCRTAINQLQKSYGHFLGKRGVASTPLNMQAIDAIEKKINSTPPESQKELRKRKNIFTRLRNLARIIANAPKTSRDWDTLTRALLELYSTEEWPEKKLIPITNTMKSMALEDSLDPSELTTAWLLSRLQTTTSKRRASLLDAAALLDGLFYRLPPEVRPRCRFGEVCRNVGGKRHSGKLPPTIEAELHSYIASRIVGTSIEGLRENRPVSLGDSIKPASTVIYDQAMKWYLDSLRVSGNLSYQEIPNNLHEIARLDWLSKVAFQALEDYEMSENDLPTLLPWAPIAPKTIESRVYALCAIFKCVNREFENQKISRLSGGQEAEPLTVTEFCKYVSRRVGGDEMSPRQREFCLKLISDENRQRLILNMHTLCWKDAKAAWDKWADLDRNERRHAINLCALAASLAIVVHFPFRGATVTQLTLGGSTPDISLPKNSGKIAFTVSGAHMKNSVAFDGLLEDKRDSQPRKIIDWFISGPRQELLKNSDLLAEKYRRPERLLAGLDTGRYGKALSTWTMDAGMRMTTHAFRHAIATILVNLCAASLEDVTRMLGNTNTDIVARHYVFIDGVNRRKYALDQMAEHRRRLGALEHPGRR